MTGEWLSPDLSVPVTPPLTSGSACRSPELLRAVVAQFELDAHPRYRARDLTGDGHPETFCNVALAELTAALGCLVPRILQVGLELRWARANDQVRWLRRAGAHGWVRCTSDEAQSAAERGHVAVVGWENPAGPGHVALVVPSDGAPGVWIAQAGATNFSRGRLGSGFGQLPVEFFLHHEGVTQ